MQVAVIEHDASGDDLVTWCYPTMAPTIQVIMIIEYFVFINNLFHFVFS